MSKYSNLGPRIATAVVLIPVVVYFLFFSSLHSLTVSLLVVSGLLAWEWGNLMQITSVALRLLYVAFVMSLSGLCLFGYLGREQVNLVYLVASGWLLSPIVLLCYPKGDWLFRQRAILALLGAVVVACFALSVQLIRTDWGVGFIGLLLLLIWGADSIAYFVGCRWGTAKLAPAISPGKSWQGFFAAIGLSVLIGVAAFYILPMKVSAANWLYFVVLSMLTVTYSVVGDLVESLLKRRAGVKDSGKLLPGHGGLLDRLDSLLAAGPIFLSALLCFFR